MNRNTKRTFVLLLTVMLAILLTATVSAQGIDPAATYRAQLTGSEEVPPVETNARGRVELTFKHDASAVRFTLEVVNATDVVAAHIHCAPAGVNGPVGVTLFAGGPVNPNGVLASGTITSTDADNACGWEDLGDVLAAIESGNAYVNVHTLANPGGEIRGQLG